MSNSRKSLKAPRAHAFQHQNGLCYYCHQPIWQANPEVFADRYQMSLKRAQFFQCTGEHLVAHSGGGSARKGNIVAACWYCNSKRHQRKTAPPPKQYERHVSKRLNKGGWHGFIAG